MAGHSIPFAVVMMAMDSRPLDIAGPVSATDWPSRILFMKRWRLNLNNTSSGLHPQCQEMKGGVIKCGMMKITFIMMSFVFQMVKHPSLKSAPSWGYCLYAQPQFFRQTLKNNSLNF
jgi:hypothetical protein